MSTRRRSAVTPTTAVLAAANGRLGEVVHPAEEHHRERLISGCATKTETTISELAEILDQPLDRARIDRYGTIRATAGRGDAAYAMPASSIGEGAGLGMWNAVSLAPPLRAQDGVEAAPEHRGGPGDRRARGARPHAHDGAILPLSVSASGDLWRGGSNRAGGWRRVSAAGPRAGPRRSVARRAPPRR